MNQSISRRAMLRLSAAQLLTLGLWPGVLRADPDKTGASFRFLVINDIHYLSDRCGKFLEQVAERIRQGKPPEFCLIVGDLSDHGTVAELGPVKDFYQSLRVPAYVVPGNHDYITQTDRSGYDRLFPESLNYRFEHRDWQFVGLDSTEGLKGGKTQIQEPTLRWLDDNVRQVDKARPTIVFTHFPLGETVPNRPLNADAVLERFLDYNVRAVFGGHHHGFTERTRGQTILVTNRCCSISKPNHDKTTEKGFFLCSVQDGQVTREFVDVTPA